MPFIGGSTPKSNLIEDFIEVTTGMIERSKSRDTAKIINAIIKTEEQQNPQILINILKRKQNNINRKALFKDYNPYNGLTPMQMAMKAGAFLSVPILLEYGVSKENMIRAAVFYDQDDYIIGLIEKNFIEPNMLMNKDPLITFLKGNRKYDIIKVLLDYGADIKAVGSSDFCRSVLMPLEQFGGPEISEEAAKEAAEELAFYFIERGADIYALGFQKENILHLAAHYGYNNLVQYLIEQKFPLDDLTSYKQSALALSIEYKRIDIAKMLIKAGATADIESELVFRGSLYIATRNNEYEIIKLLLKEDISKEILSYALFVSCHAGYIDIAKLLIAKGADLDFKVTHPKDSSPLEIAFENEHFDIINLLLTKGANPNIVFTPWYSRIFPFVHTLWYATETNNIELVKLLIAKGVEIDWHSSKSSTALKLAIAKKHFEIARILLENGANISLVYKDREHFEYYLEKSSAPEELLFMEKYINKAFPLGDAN